MSTLICPLIALAPRFGLLRLIRSLPLWLSLAAVPMPLALADGLPDLGDESQIAVSPLIEKKAGERVMNDIRLHEPSYLDDPEVNGYLENLGRRLATASNDPTYGFNFFAMRDAQINAFATYGGYVGVNTGLIVAAQSESELASVLAHEVSHVTQHHLARGVSKQKQSSVATMVAMGLALLAARSNPQVTTAAVVSAQAASIQSQLTFTREFEREADRIGFDTLSKAGFDVHGMAAFFTRLQKETRLYENNAPAYLRTHPLTGERIADMQNRAADLPYKQVVDSLDFSLVRAKLRVEQLDARDAVIDSAALLKEHKYTVEAAARYGYVRALLRDKQLAAAERELKLLQRLKIVSPMIDKLAADLAVARNDFTGAEALYRDALKREPLNRALIYGLADTLIAVSGRGMAATLNDKSVPCPLPSPPTPLPQERGDSTVACRDAHVKHWLPAQQFVDQALQERPQDYQLYAFKAKIAHSLGQRFQTQRAQAEVYALQGQTQAAIEQLQMAQRAGDASFYEMSAADARLRELKARRLEENNEHKQ